MQAETPLDRAHAALTVSADAEALFYRGLLDAVLFVLLESEARDETLVPRVFQLEDGPVILAFDSEERLASLDAGPVPYAALPGRVIVAQMAGQGLGLGLNLGTGAGSEMLLPPDALDWLAQHLGQSPHRVTALPEQFHAARLPQQLSAMLALGFAGALGLADRALLVAVRYGDGRHGHLLAIVDAKPGSEPALTHSVAESLAFSGLDAAELDVAFLAGDDPVLLRIAAVGLLFELPVEPTSPAKPPATPPGAPGMDPDRPPKLR